MDALHADANHISRPEMTPTTVQSTPQQCTLPTRRKRPVCRMRTAIRRSRAVFRNYGGDLRARFDAMSDYGGSS